MDIWLNKKCSTPSVFVIIVIKSLWSKGNGKRAVLEWIFPLLGSDNGFDNAL